MCVCVTRGGNSVFRGFFVTSPAKARRHQSLSLHKRKPCSAPDRSVSGCRVAMGQYISTMFYGNGAADDKHQWQDNRDDDRWDEENGEMQPFVSAVSC